MTPPAASPAIIGLGTDIVEVVRIGQMIERHGGHIEVESAPGVGSRFRFVLPRTADTAPSSSGDGAAVAEAT